MRSEKLFRQALRYFPGGVNSPVRFYKPYPIFVQKGIGSHVWDVDGNSYIDLCLGYGPLILGHAHPVVKKAIVEALEQSWLVGTPTTYELELAKYIKESIPNIELMRFTNSGTEATMHVIRVARAYAEKMKIIKVLGGYHGAHDSVLVKAGSSATSIPSTKGIPIEVAKNTILVEYNDIETLVRVIKTYKNEIAAVIVEPVLGNIGVIPPKPEYLKQVREITEQHDILLILDEVITAFRARYGSVQPIFNVTADLITLGKIVGGGLPVGVFGGQEEIMRMIAPEGKVYVAGTFSGNPIVMAAGATTLKTLKTQDYEKLNNSVAHIVKKLRDYIDNTKQNLTVNVFGSMFQLFFTKEPVINHATAMKANKRKYFQFFSELLKEGIYIPPSQYESNFMSFAHTFKDQEKIINSMLNILERMKL